MNVVVDRTQHDVARGAVDLGGDHGPDRTDVIDEDRLVLAGVSAGAGGEDDGIAAGDGVVDRVFEVGQDRWHAQRVELRALNRTADHGDGVVGTCGEASQYARRRVAVGTDDEDAHQMASANFASVRW